MRRYDGLRNRWFLDPLYGRGYPADIWALCGADAPQVESDDLATIAEAHGLSRRQLLLFPRRWPTRPRMDRWPRLSS